MGNLPQKISSNTWLAVAFIVLFVVSAYSPILNNSFKVIYDTDTIVGNPQVRQLHLAGIFAHSGRPLTLTSHALEYRFFSLTPFFYYLFNILLHTANALLVYGLMVLLIGERPIAFLVSLFFAIHPAHWQAVSLLSGRPELLNAFFNLSALVCCMYYMRKLNGWWMGLSLLFFACALLARESREFVLGVFFFYFLYLTPEEDKKEIRWVVLLPYLVVTFLDLGLRRGMSAWPHLAAASGPSVGILSAVRSIVVEVQNLLMPGELYFRQTVAASYDLLAWIALALIIALAGLLLVFHKKLSRTVLFLMAWFLVGLWPIMQTAFVMGPGPGRLLVGDTFVYLPVIPLAALVVLFFRRLLEVSKDRNAMAQPVVTVAAAGFIALFFLLTYKNAGHAYDEIALLEETQGTQPPNASVQYSLGLLYAHQNNFPQAQYHFAQAAAIDPHLVEAQVGLARALYAQGRFLDAVKTYEAISDPGKFKRVIDNELRTAYNVLTLNQEAVLQKNPQDINAYFSLGIFYKKQGELAKAIDSYQKVIDLDPADQAGLRTLALRFQGMLLQETGDTAKALDNFQRAR
jgi:Tfp pilus assembly protein PilF